MLMSREEAIAALDKSVEDDESIDITLKNGILASSKEMYPNGSGFSVFHEIDGTVTYFSRDDAIEVLTGERSPWEGEVL